MLGVHIIGHGIGESVVIQLPSGDVGVVDCYATSLKGQTRESWLAGNATLRFLSNDLRANELAFLAVTHPHEDHARGISQLLNYFENRIHRIWVFDGLEERYLQAHFRTAMRAGIKSAAERQCSESCGSFLTEFLRIRNEVVRRVRSANRPAYKVFRGRNRVELDRGRVYAYFLGPEDNLLARYKASLADDIANSLDESRRKVRETWNAKSVNHNAVSPAIVLEYGKTRILLGGDMESPAWKAVLDSDDDSLDVPDSMASCLVKAAHHGSGNGYCRGLYERIASGGRRPIVVITPFKQQKLPQGDAVQHLRNYATELLTTNADAANHALGIRHAAEAGTLPQSWVRLLAKHPKWSGAVDNSFLQTPGPSLSTLPLELCREIIRDPGLAKHLRPELRNELPKLEWQAQPESSSRLSFFFNDKGFELKRQRYTGRNAGVL